MTIILITGNPCEGFQFIGPFSDMDSAVEHAERNHRGGTWWIANLIDPTTQEEGR